MTAPDAPPEDRVRADCQLLREQINRQALLPRSVALIGLVLLVVVWFVGARELVGLGSRLTYDSIRAMDGQVTSLLQRASPYLWGVAALVWTLLALGAGMAWLRWRIRLLRAQPVDPAAFAALAPRLGHAVLDVMAWCWATPRREPLTLGDLQRTLAEIRHGRIEKLAHLRRQQDWVDGLSG